MHSGALSGIKVLDLTRVLAGPWATQNLADLGADVIKVEQPGKGDDTRQWGPPFVSGKGSRSAYFSCANRNKRSYFIDIKSAQGQSIIKALAEQADIVIENFKAGYLSKLGLDYDTLSSINPRLIYCSITGFGQTGPCKDKPGYDLLIQAMCGLMSVNGEPNQEPQKVGVAVTDLFTGLYATIGVLAALNERLSSGLGQYIDLALLDVGVSMMANQASSYLIDGTVPTRMGNAHPSIVPYQTFSTATDPCVVAVGNDAQFQRFCDVLGHPQWADDKKFCTNPERVKHRALLVESIQNIMTTQSRDAWLTALENASVPCAPVNTIEQVFDEPQIKARHMRTTINDESNNIDVVANPLVFSRTPTKYTYAPPKLSDQYSEDDPPQWCT